MYHLFQFLCHMEILTVVSTIFCPFIIRNVAVVSILFSNGKSNRCFNTFLALHCKQSIRFIKFFFCKWKIQPWVQQFFSLSLYAIHSLLQFFSQMGNGTVVWTFFRPSIIGNLSVVLILLSHGKSNRCYNNFLAWYCKQSTPFFNFF